MLSVSQNGYCQKFIILYCTPAIVLAWCSLMEYRLYMYCTCSSCISLGIALLGQSTREESDQEILESSNV